jgi:hypothetical protein
MHLLAEAGLIPMEVILAASVGDTGFRYMLIV